jgi:hypothetical protein
MDRLMAVLRKEEVLAALAPTLQQTMTVAANRAFVVLDGTLLPASPRTAPTTLASTGATV